MATPRSYGKGQISTPYKIKTPERIGMKFGTVDYVLEICPQTKFGDDWISGDFWVNMWNIRSSVTLFFPNRPYTHKPIFTQNGLNDVDSRIDVPFVVKIETFSNPWSGPENRQNLALLGRDFEIFCSISPLALAVSKVNTSYSSSEPHKSVTVNRQIGVGDSKYIHNV